MKEDTRKALKLVGLSSTLGLTIVIVVSPRVLESPTSLRAFLVSSFMKATPLLLARPPAHELRLLKDST